MLPRLRRSSLSGESSLGSALPPLTRARTPSGSGSSLLPPLASRLDTFSVPPPSTSTEATKASRGTACLPCRRSHLKCGKGMRPCKTCCDRGRPEDCMEGVPPEQAASFMRLYYQRKAQDAQSSSPGPSKPVFGKDVTLFPASDDFTSSSRDSVTYPSFGAAATGLAAFPPLGVFDMPTLPPAKRPVYLVMGKDLRVGRASQDCLRTLGFHPHEMINQVLSFYLINSDRDRFAKFSGQLFAFPIRPGGSIPATPVELARMSMDGLIRPVHGMRSIADEYTFRTQKKEHMPVSIELWFGSYFGAHIADVRSFDQALIIAKITPLASPALPPIGSSSGSPGTFPSVLMPIPGGGGGLPPLDRRRAPSLTGRKSFSSLPPLSLSDSLPPLTMSGGLPRLGGSGLPPLSSSTLPPLSMSGTGRLPPLKSSFPSLSLDGPSLGSHDRLSTLANLSSRDGLPRAKNDPLPPIMLPGYNVPSLPRKRTGSAAGLLPLPTMNDYDHGAGLYSSSRPRLREPSPAPGHRRSVSSETGRSSYSGSSSEEGYAMLPPLPGISSRSSALPGSSGHLPRPSGSQLPPLRRPSYGSSRSGEAHGLSSTQPALYPAHRHRKSVIEIDGSHRTPPLRSSNH